MKVLLIATVQSHICQFHKPLVTMLHEHGCEVHVAARNNLAEKNGLKLDFVEQVFNVPFQRSPFSPKNLGAYNQLKKIIDDGNYDVIHCNTPVAWTLDGEYGGDHKDTYVEILPQVVQMIRGEDAV